MTLTPLSRSKGQGRQAALLSTALTRKAAGNVVGVGKYCYVTSAQRRMTGEEGPGAYCVATRTACSVTWRSETAKTLRCVCAGFCTGEEILKSET